MTIYTGPDRCDCGAKTGEHHLPACHPDNLTQPSKWAVTVVARTTYVVQANSMAEANDIARNLASGESATVEACEPYNDTAEGRE